MLTPGCGDRHGRRRGWFSGYVGILAMDVYLLALDNVWL